MNQYRDLAEAMRKGAALRPQATNGEYFEMSLSEHPSFASCALGAAYEAVHGPFETPGDVPDYLNAEQDWTEFPCLWDVAPVCPDLACAWTEADSVYLEFDSRDRLFDLINHMNDEHKWTRQSVANWLDTL